KHCAHERENLVNHLHLQPALAPQTPSLRSSASLSSQRNFDSANRSYTPTPPRCIHRSSSTTAPSTSLLPAAASLPSSPSDAAPAARAQTAPRPSHYAPP